MKPASRKFGNFVLIGLLAISIAINIFFIANMLNRQTDNNSSSEPEGAGKYVGTWRDDREEIIVFEDGTFTWVSYSNEEDGSEFVLTARKGYIAEDVMIFEQRYSALKNAADGTIVLDDEIFQTVDVVPDEYWTTPDNKWGGYQIVFHGQTFGLKTDATITEYNFVKQ